MPEITDTYYNTDLKNAVPRKHRSYPMSVRLKAVTMSEIGMGSLAIGNEMGIDSSLIRVWVRKYKKYGIDGLKSASYTSGRKADEIVKAHTPESDVQGRAIRYGFVRHVDNPSLMLILIVPLLDKEK